MRNIFLGLAVSVVGVNAFATSAPLVDKVVLVGYACYFNI